MGAALGLLVGALVGTADGLGLGAIVSVGVLDPTFVGCGVPVGDTVGAAEGLGLGAGESVGTSVGSLGAGVEKGAPNCRPRSASTRFAWSCFRIMAPLQGAVKRRRRTARLTLNIVVRVSKFQKQSWLDGLDAFSFAIAFSATQGCSSSVELDCKLLSG